MPKNVRERSFEKFGARSTTGIFEQRVGENLFLLEIGRTAHTAAVPETKSVVVSAGEREREIMAASASSLSELRAQYEDFLRGEVRKDNDNDNILTPNNSMHSLTSYDTSDHNYSVTILQSASRQQSTTMYIDQEMERVVLLAGDAREYGA
jgi:hypothetical protein